MSGGGVLRIAVPALADAIAGLSGQGETVRLPAAEWLLARGRARAADPAGWRDWVLADAGLGAGVLQRVPAGPCAIADVTGGPTAGTWARAEPVHLLTAIDHLKLAAPVPVPLAGEESAELLAALNRHLDGTGFSLQPAIGGGWLCSCPAGLDCATVEPAAAIGRNLRDLLPTGPDAARLRALVNELQMLLHEHPVNERRVARGQPPVNSVWLWGVGAAAATTGTAQGVLVTDDAWLAGLWRLHGGEVRAVGDFATVIGEAAGDVRVAVVSLAPAGDGAAALRSLDEAVLAPARAALLASQASRVLLHAGRGTFEVTPLARWAFWRRQRPLAEVLA